MDKDLDNLLSAYVVADADAALLDKITIRVETKKNAPLRYARIARVAVWALVAVTGFWLGSAEPTVETAEVSQDYVGRLINGPSSVNDILL